MTSSGIGIGLRIALKSMFKSIARGAFGLDIRSARRGLDNPLNCGYGLKWLSRFMHFERLLQTLMNVDGAIVECGVGPGRSILDFSVISNAIGRPRRILGYDTFRGIPDSTKVDGSWNTDIGGTWDYSQARVKENLRGAGLDSGSLSRIEFVEGDLRNTLPSYDAGKIALLHLDVDLYESYKTALESLYVHVVPGGAIAFDEYRLEAWPGATKAIDEFFEGKPERIVRSDVANRYFTIKCP